MTAKLMAAEEIVYGIGYPPIKTVTKNQAFLMARRAAILDAYSKRVWRKGVNKEDSYFIHMSAFIRQMKITDEELLPDGGVKITLSMEHSKTTPGVTSQEQVHSEKRILQNQQSGPKKINRQQWFQVISKVVTFETSQHLEKSTK